MSEWKKTICPYDCPASCGLLAEVEDGHILRVKGDPENKVTKGLICNKMQHYERAINSSERLTVPLKRVGAKGEGRFEPISWEEAIREVTDRWKEIITECGASAILPVYYSGVMSLIQRKGIEALSACTGMSKLVMSLCSQAKSAAQNSVMGETGCLDPRELEYSDYYLIWGCNAKATRIHTMPLLKQARDAGKKVVLIEVCGCDMASYCDETILLRPGSDGALALAMMHVMEREHLTDEAFLQEYTYGYETFRETLSKYTPQWAESITGVVAGTIERLAREYAAAKAPAILLGSGPSRQGNGGMNCRLIQILPAFVGAWKHPGGGYCGGNPAAGSYFDADLVQHPELRKEPPHMININLLGAALSDTETSQPIRSVYVAGGNPVNSVSDQTAVIRGLMREDLFTVVHDRYLTDTARYADILLPATYSVEHTDCYTPYGYCMVGMAKKLVDPPGECKCNWDVIRLLAVGMGYEEDCFKRTSEELAEEILSHPHSGLKEMSQGQWEKLRAGDMVELPYADHLTYLTPTGKLQIVDERLEIPVPEYIENYGGAQSLQLVCVPGLYTLNTVFHERKDLLKHSGSQCLILNPEDAKKRGILEGDQVIAWNELAEAEFEAHFSELLLPGTAAAPGVHDSRSTGISGKNARVGLNVNALHHARVTDLGEATSINDNTIEVRKK